MHGLHMAQLHTYCSLSSWVGRERLLSGFRGHDDFAGVKLSWPVEDNHKPMSTVGKRVWEGGRPSKKGCSAHRYIILYSPITDGNDDVFLTKEINISCPSLHSIVIAFWSAV